MKITKGADKLAQEKLNKERASIGCNKCPVCGETRKFMDALTKDKKPGGILNATYSTFSKGIFKSRSFRIDHYSCQTCGARWDSEPYEYFV